MVSYLDMMGLVFANKSFFCLHLAGRAEQKGGGCKHHQGDNGGMI